METVKLDYSEDLSLAAPTEDPQREGYKMVGWTTTPFDSQTGELPYYPLYVPLTDVQTGIQEYDFYAYWVPEESTAPVVYSHDETASKTVIRDYNIEYTFRNRLVSGDSINPPYAHLLLPPGFDVYEKTIWYDCSREAVVGFWINTFKATTGISWLTLADGTKMLLGVRQSADNRYIGRGGTLFENNPSYSIVYLEPPFEERLLGSPSSYKPDVGCTLPTNKTKEGYVFAGWYDNPELEGEPITEILPGEKGDRVFFAKWVEE